MRSRGPATYKWGIPMTHPETLERGNALWLTLRHPPLNILDIRTFEALDAALRPLQSRSDLKAVVIRSGLPGTFSAGSDVGDHTRERAPAMLRAFHAVIRRLHALPLRTDDASEGIAAFLEKRRPRWSDR